MSEPRRIAVVHDYDELIAALRARADELNVSRETIDAVSGLQSGYSGKLLSWPPARSLGRVSLGPTLQALGLAFVVVEDAEALRRFASRHAVRRADKVSGGKHPPIKFQISRRKLILMARKGGENRAKKLSAKRRQIISRKGGRARWRKARRVSPAAKAYRGTPRAPADSRPRPPSVPPAAGTLRPAAQSRTE